MAYFDCQHHQLFIANFAKHAIITDAIAPFARMIGYQALPERTRILAPVNILSSQDTMTRRTPAPIFRRGMGVSSLHRSTSMYLLTFAVTPSLSAND